jgi:hypothetical protein
MRANAGGTGCSATVTEFTFSFAALDCDRCLVLGVQMIISVLRCGRNRCSLHGNIQMNPSNFNACSAADISICIYFVH